MGAQPQTFVDENGVPTPIMIARDGLGRPVLPIAVASGVQNGQYDSQGNFRVTLATALSQALDSILTYPRGTNSAALTGTGGLILTGAGKFSGIIVTSGTNPTVKVWDSTTATGTVLIDQFTATVGTMYSFPNVRVQNGAFVTLGGTSPVATAFYDPTTT